MTQIKSRLVEVLRRTTAWSRAHLPWGFRSVLGLLFLILGFLGFLPVIGFWMIPVGLSLIALDIPPWRRRLSRWLDEQHEKKAQ